MKLQKRLAASILKCSPSRVRFDSDKLEEIKESITKADTKGLVSRGIISRSKTVGPSKVRTRKTAVQKRKGRRKGHGSRKGKFNARADEKAIWISKVRAQRAALKRIKDKGHITSKDYGMIYSKVKGGFFRSVQHMKMFMEDNGLFKDGKK
ncbi:50S ribosomal protein L19e [Candidatus Woesearchaeota archaeon]|nr:50S ribosomal protein L19e [Candidatus Woesearchaeota archaeon]